LDLCPEALARYVVLGNHECWTDASAVSRSIAESGIRLLTNANTRLPNGVVLVGIDDEWSGSPDAGGRDLLYVNRGTEAAFPPVRFSHRPEVTLFILHPSNARKPHVIRHQAQP